MPPVTESEAEEVTLVFTDDYPGALDLAYQFCETVAELYGEDVAAKSPDIKGAYISEETIVNGRVYCGRVDVPLQNATSVNDLMETLKHEVLGHYGTNTFTPAEKRALLDGIATARNEPTLKPLWDDVNQNYANRSLDMRAEEVFARHCENIEPSQHQIVNQVQQRGQQSFKETCIARTRTMQAEDLDNIACMVAQGLRDRSRTQQNFPQPNKQFRTCADNNLAERQKAISAMHPAAQKAINDHIVPKLPHKKTIMQKSKPPEPER